MLKYGLADCVRNIRPTKFEMENKDRIELWIESLTISKPRVPQTAIKVRTKAMFPSECRQRAISYKGMCDVRLGWRVNGQKMPSIDKELGEVPIMLKVSICSLRLDDHNWILFYGLCVCVCTVGRLPSERFDVTATGGKGRTRTRVGRLLYRQRSRETYPYAIDDAQKLSVVSQTKYMEKSRTTIQ